MGRKISVDSATLMNKGLEVIEAHWLFGAAAGQIEVVVHPESIVHSLVEYPDGSVLAQLGNPDMRTALAQALAWPERIDSGVPALDLQQLRQSISNAGSRDFPLPRPGFQALASGGTAPTTSMQPTSCRRCVSCRYPAFPGHRRSHEATLAALPASAASDLESLIYADLTARKEAQRMMQRSFC
jgi:1-deoxy-D-xylulose-5-phosphate reductoisomerase